MDDLDSAVVASAEETDEVSRFTESYASFNRIINSLQRKYIELQEEFTAQNDKLVEANMQLIDLSRRQFEATEFLNSLLDSISAGVIAVDQSGRVTHFSRAASLILGIPREQPLGKRYRDILPAGRPSDANALRAAETGREVTAVEKEINLGDNRSRHISVSTAILRDRQGNANGAVELFHDITKTRRMEAELARLNTLAALGEMAATVAHEVRNPLSAVAGFAALLKRDLETDDPRRVTVDKITCGVDRLNRTIETLLNYSRFQQISRQEIRYQDFIVKTVGQYLIDNEARLGKTRIDVAEFEPADATGTTVSIDAVLCRQAILNILDNSLEALGGKGEVVVRALLLSREKATAAYGERVLLDIDETILETIISDNGPGVEEEHVEKIFAPFFSTRPDGNGLGLAVAWKIMKTHSGDILVKRSEEGGAAFHLLLPARIAHQKREHH